MSTNASISIKVGEVYHTIYNHWDGYITGTGLGGILNKHYKSEKKVKRLISMGDVSSLDRRINKKQGHAFNDRADGCSAFYIRDRADAEDLANSNARTYNSIDEIANGYDGQRYNYIYDNGVWSVQTEYYKKGELVLLSEVLNSDFED